MSFFTRLTSIFSKLPFVGIFKYLAISSILYHSYLVSSKQLILITGVCACVLGSQQKLFDPKSNTYDLALARSHIVKLKVS